MIPRGSSGNHTSAGGPTFIAFGVNALTSDYLIGEVDQSTLVEAAVAEELRSKASIHDSPPVERLSLGRAGNERGWGDLDRRDLNEARWGVIFAADADQAVKDALKRLQDHRRSDAVFTYQPGETFVDWIVRNGGQPGSGEPNSIPYYLCIVGGPDEIPFTFQFGLDIEYGVGRLCFDQVAHYDQYINNVIDYENPKNPLTNLREVVLMGTAHPGDTATALSSDHLLLPLVKAVDRARFSTTMYSAARPGGQHPLVRGEMTKDNLLALLSSRTDHRPTLLLTASHGWAYPSPDNRQRMHQGALVCQGWRPGEIDPDPAWLFAARDVPERIDLRGLVIFSFACFSAGTPRTSYYQRLWAGPIEAASESIAETAFIAALPKKLLSRPNGPLGFFGHIEQTWASSFLVMTGDDRVSSIRAFERALKSILNGYPLGHALGDFNDRNGSLSPEVSGFLEQKLANQPVDETAFAARWLERNDARGFVLLGDPGVAVRAYELQAGDSIC